MNSLRIPPGSLNISARFLPARAIYKKRYALIQIFDGQAQMIYATRLNHFSLAPGFIFWCLVHQLGFEITDYVDRFIEPVDIAAAGFYAQARYLAFAAAGN